MNIFNVSLSSHYLRNIPDALKVEPHQLCPIEYHKSMYQSIFKFPTSDCKNAGHLPKLEQPEATNTEL